MSHWPRWWCMHRRDMRGCVRWGVRCGGRGSGGRRGYDVIFQRKQSLNNAKKIHNIKMVYMIVKVQTKRSRRCSSRKQWSIVALNHFLRSENGRTVETTSMSAASIIFIRKRTCLVKRLRYQNDWLEVMQRWVEDCLWAAGVPGPVVGLSIATDITRSPTTRKPILSCFL